MPDDLCPRLVTFRADRPFVDSSSGSRSVHRSNAVHLRARSTDCMVPHLLQQVDGWLLVAAGTWWTLVEVAEQAID